MPSERPRRKTKEDTWGTEELSKSIKDAMRDDSAKKHRSADKEKRRDGERTKDREHRKDKDKDRRDKHRSDDVNDHDRKKDKDKESRKRDGSHREKSDKDRRHKDEGESSRDRDKERRREDRDKEKSDKRHKDDRDRKPKENGESRSHDKDRDREKRHRDEKDRRDKGRDKDKDRERHKDSDKERKHRDDKDRDKDRRHRDDKEKSSHDKERRKDKEKDREKRRKEDDKEIERKHRKDEDRKHRSDNKDEEKEHKRHRDKDEKIKTHDKEDKAEDNVKEEENQAEEDDNGYEDDFEDYDDDFEDEDDDETSEKENEDGSSSGVTRESSAEMDEIRRAMASENQAMHSGRLKETTSSAGSSRGGTSKSSRSFINFVAAKQRTIDQQVMSHTRKRGKELMKLIELDVVGFDLFDMAPVKEYELYIKSFGRSNTKQAFVQYNEDNLDRDIQTDAIESRETWTQHPAEGVRASGGAWEKHDEDGPISEEDSLRLTQFLQKAGQAISILLEEESSENAKGMLQSNQRNIVFSEGYAQLNSQLAILKGRHVVHAQFHPVQTNLLLTVHSASKKAEEAGNLASRGLLCVWNVNEPSRPQKILSCKSTPTCCCFSPTKSTLAFSGTVDGSIIVWDLREPSSMHASQVLDDQEWTIRVPTFSTDGIQSQENHHSPVVTIQPIVAAEESLKASMQSSHTTENTSGLSFQLASLEEKGIINFSVVIELDKADQAGSESDLGLAPYGKIKLIKTSSVSLATGPSRGFGDVMKTCHMQLSPLDPNQFFVATDSGNVLHGARHGGKVPPRMYRDHLEILVEILQIDFSPFGLPVFLVACADGSIRLYNTTSDLPVITWSNSTSGSAIKNIQWSRSRPSVFYVMDEASKVYVWELLENDGAPVKTEQFTHASLTFLTLSSDHPGAGRGQPGKRQEMLITDAKGAMDVHRINQTFSIARQNELHDMTELLNKIM